mgnify:CR=1 FL=1
MWFLYPDDFFWKLNAEKGYGTLYSTAQLFLLGIVVLITAREDYGDGAQWRDKFPWFFVAFVYFFIGLDDCVGIHENFIAIGGKLALDSVIFHFIHEWLWFYAPIALGVAVCSSRRCGRSVSSGGYCGPNNRYRQAPRGSAPPRERAPAAI